MVPNAPSGWGQYVHHETCMKFLACFILQSDEKASAIAADLDVDKAMIEGKYCFHHSPPYAMRVWLLEISNLGSHECLKQILKTVSMTSK